MQTTIANSARLRVMHYKFKCSHLQILYKIFKTLNINK